ncbi:RDD family protein [Helicobacter anseris]|uniref:RDD family protein n=2 Tax=Helicobacter anseris TaxID=375926 RepID=A0A3D8J6C6_9HELI|nr:RDD family protein [Helicobacter anseris]
MIYTPILYIMTYFILDGAKSFQSNQGAIFLCFILYGVITASFLSAKMQTPGFKYAQIRLTNHQGKKIGFIHAFLRFIIWSLSMTFLIGFFFPFFNKKNECLHDYICKTKISFQK